MMSDCNESKNRLKLILAYLQSNKLFADVIDYFIERSGKKQKTLATELNVDTSAITHWRKGRRIPQDSMFIFRIATVLSLSPQERQKLLIAWHTTRSFKGLIPYVETAIDEGDEPAQIVEALVEYLQNAFNTVDE